MKLRSIALALGTATVLVACASQPKPLQGAFAEISPQDAVASDRTGAVVRWGGRVVAVEPQAQRTCFHMISTRLGGTGRPVASSDDTGGRFVACRTGFYDPALFQPNREVTFTGRVSGLESRKIGDYDYRLPVMDADVVYLWPIRERVDVVQYPSPWPWWGWW